MITPSNRTSQWMVGLLLTAGVIACWFTYPLTRHYDSSFSHSTHREVDAYLSVQRFVVLAALALAVIPATRRAVAGLLKRLAQPSTSVRRWTALAVALLSLPVLYGLAIARGRYLHPLWNDEKMHRLQTTFLAHFRFYMPTHPVGDAFEVPYVFVRPVTAPVYFPGTSLLHVPGMWAHLPYWFTPLVIAGISLALLYLIVTDLIDGAAGLLAVVMMVSLSTFRWLALVEMSHSAGLMWGLVAFWSWLAWRRSRHARWAALAGLAAGWYAIVRPLDAICVLTPLAVAWAWELRSVSPQVRWRTAVLACFAAAPLLSMQMAFDRAVTGHMLVAPLEQYYRTYFNTSSLGLQHFDPAFRPPSMSPQIQTLYDKQEDPAIKDFSTVGLAIRQWWRTRLPVMISATMPSLLLITLLPVAMAGLTDRRRWVMWAALWCYLIGSGFFYAFHSHYSAAIAPAVICMVLLGAKSVGGAWPQQGVVAVFLWLAIFGVAAQSICRDEQAVHPGPAAPLAQATETAMARIVRAPAIVLCHVDPRDDLHDYPAYNVETLSPDDAPIIRAHDLGPQHNHLLLRYYARLDPARNVYMLDMTDMSVRALGNVKKLADEGGP